VPVPPVVVPPVVAPPVPVVVPPVVVPPVVVPPVVVPVLPPVPPFVPPLPPLVVLPPEPLLGEPVSSLELHAATLNTIGSARPMVVRLKKRRIVSRIMRVSLRCVPPPSQSFRADVFLP